MPEIKNWSHEEDIFDFAREFLISGESTLQEILRGETPDGTIQGKLGLAQKLVGTLASLLPFGSELVTTVIGGFISHLDNISKTNMTSAIEEAVKSSGNHIFQERFHRLLVKSAVEIAFSFERQLQKVSRRVGPTNAENQEKALQILASFAGKICVQKLISSPKNSTTKNLHAAILFQDEFHLFDKILAKYDQIMVDQLFLNWDENNNNTEPKSVSKLNFFKSPFPAYTPSSPMKEPLNKIFLKKQSLKKWQDVGASTLLLRKPMDFEWEAMMQCFKFDEEFVPISDMPQKLEGKLRLDFSWRDRSDLIDNLYTKISKSLPISDLDGLYDKIGELILEKNSELVLHLEKILVQRFDQLQAEVGRNHEISKEIYTEIQKLSKIIESGMVVLPTGDASLKGRVPSSSNRQQIRFNIKEPIPSFTGRSTFLKNLHQNFESSMSPKENTTSLVLSHVKVICGLGGIGKSETARKYVHQYESNYTHIIWIDSETSQTMTESFQFLAESELKIPTKTNEGDWRPIDTVVKEVYEIICQQSSLFIFDNAECLENKEGQDGGIKPFLPTFLSSRLKKPNILVTSRSHQWRPLPSKPIPLEILSKQESANFIISFLQENLEDGRHSNEDFLTENGESEGDQVDDLGDPTDQLIDLLDGLPLSLQVAASCIQNLADRKSISIFAAMRLYTKEYVGGHNSKEFLHYFDTSISSKSVFMTMLLSMEKIQQINTQGQGDCALEVIKYLSFLYSDEIPKEFVFQFFPNTAADTSECERVEKGLALLRQFSLIKIHGIHISIHRQVQQVIMEKLGQDQQKLCTLSKLVDHVQLILQSWAKPADQLFNTILKNCLRLCENLKSDFETQSKFRDFVFFLADKILDLGMHREATGLFESLKKCFQSNPTTFAAKILEMDYHVGRCHLAAGRYREAYDIFDKVFKQQRAMLGSDASVVWQTLSKMASACEFLMNYEEALEISENCLTHQLRRFGPQHPDTLITLNTKAFVLHRLKRYDEALVIFKSVLQDRIKILGENDVETLRTQNCLANVFDGQGHREEALKLYREVHAKQLTVLGANHPLTLAVQYNIGRVLISNEMYEDALHLLQDVAEREIKTYGEDHPYFLHTKERIANALRSLKRFDEAEKIYREIYKAEQTIWGDYHVKTFDAELDIGYLLEEKEDYDEARKIYEKVYKMQEETLGGKHEDSLKTKRNLGDTYKLRGMFEKGLEVNREVAECRREILSDDHVDTISSYIEVGFCLQSLKRHDEALEIYNRILVSSKRSLGMTHVNTRWLLKWMSKIEEEKGNYERALNLLDDLRAAEIKLSGDDDSHENVLECDWNKGKIFVCQEKMMEAVKIYESLYIREKKLEEEDASDITQFLIKLTKFFITKGRLKECAKFYFDLYKTTVDDPVVLVAAGDDVKGVKQFIDKSLVMLIAMPLIGDSDESTMEIFEKCLDMCSYIRELFATVKDGDWVINHVKEYEEKIRVRKEKLEENEKTDEIDGGGGGVEIKFLAKRKEEVVLNVKDKEEKRGSCCSIL